YQVRTTVGGREGWVSASSLEVVPRPRERQVPKPPSTSVRTRPSSAKTPRRGPAPPRGRGSTHSERTVRPPSPPRPPAVLSRGGQRQHDEPGVPALSRRCQRRACHVPDGGSLPTS